MPKRSNQFSKRSAKPPAKPAAKKAAAKPKRPQSNSSIFAQVAREERALQERQSVAAAAQFCGLQAWLEDVTPEWNWKYRHLVFIQGYLDKVTSGEINRLILCVPPRHGKSEQTTVRYPIYRLSKDPKFRVIVGAYSAALAKKFSRKMRKIVRALEVGPDRLHNGIRLSRESSAVEDWETTEGGGVRAVGVGGGVTGMGANLIVIDDPVKSRAEANSPTYREAVWDWYTDDIRTRLEPGGAVIVIMTRWHEDDLVGRLLQEMKNGGEEWVLINLPAEAEENDQMGRAVGEALCPERYDLSALGALKKVLKNSYWALFQQRPQPAEGSFFKRQWFKTVPCAPAGLTWVRYWDLAASTKTTGDSTASAAVALDPSTGNLYIRDMVCGQWEWPDAKKIIIETMKAEPKVRHGVELKMHGLAAVQDLRREKEIAHVPLRGVEVDGDKQSRAIAWQDRAEDGKVFLVTGEAEGESGWINTFLVEVTGFPNAKHDDQVDTISGGVAMIGRTKSKKLRTY